jgi:hypothetical protein
MSQQIDAIKTLFGELFAKLMAFSLEEEFLPYLGESLEVFYNLQEGEEYEFDPSEEFLFLSWFKRYAPYAFKGYRHGSG